MVVWILLCTFCVKDTSCTATSNLNNLLLFFTFVVLVFYTNETNLLREEAQKQNITAIRPVVIPYFKENVVLARNKANGIAVNIYLLELERNEVKNQFKFSGQDINPFALALNDQFSFSRDSLKECDSSHIKVLLPYTSKLIDTITQHKNGVVVCLVYSDLDDRRYYTVAYASPGSTTFDNRLEFGKLD